MKGVYILLAFLAKDTRLKTGALGEVHFKKGFYAYSGSAMGGLEQRIRRHLRKNKKLHWHIDYLLNHAEIKMIAIRKTDRKSDECAAARRLLSLGGVPVDGFGSSDCSCNAHLLFFKTINNKSGCSSQKGANDEDVPKINFRHCK